MPLLQPTDSIHNTAVSVFSNHALHTINPAPVFRTGTTYYWPALVLFFVFSVYVYLNTTQPKKLLQIFLAVYSNQASKQLYREDYKLSKKTSVLLCICFVLVSAFLLYTVNNYFGLILRGLYPLKQFLFFLTVIIAGYLIKLLTDYFISFTTKTRELNSEYTFNLFIYCQVLGIILLPLLICIEFSRYSAEWFLYPAITICAIFYVLRLTRGFIISVIEQNIGVLYIFLYFCILEILPLLVLIKFLLVNF